MRRRTALLIIGGLFVASAPLGALAHNACPPGDDSGHTAAGSCKQRSTGAVHCGTTGPVGPSVANVRFFANAAPNNTELEACNDSGGGNTQGRAVVRARNDSGGQGVRASLDTDDGQPFPAGYITVQAGTAGTGVWCNEDSTTVQPNNDGYAQPWATPGTDGSGGSEPGDLPGPAECLPMQ